MTARTPLSLPLVVDSTILSTFRACQEKAGLEYVEHLAPSGLSIDLHAGACIASGLEALYATTYGRGLDLAAGLGAAELAFTEAWGDYEIPEHRLSGPRATAKTFDRCLEAIFSYGSHYHPPTDHVAPFPDVERPWEFSFGIPLTQETTGLAFPLHPSGDPFIYAGRFDLLGLYLGLPCVRDDKTTSSMSATWHDSWTLRAQFMGYCWALRQLGITVEAVIVRGIVIQKTQIQHIEAEKRFPSHLIDRWLRMTLHDIRNLVAAAETGWWQPSFGTECTSYGGCSFRDICASPDPDRWKADFHHREWNPLVRGA